MIATVTGEQRQAAKRQIIELGASVQEARTTAAVSMHRTTVYRLLRRTQAEAQAAFSDGRHGHPIKLRGEARTFLIDFCRTSPSVSSPALQTALRDRFGLIISVSQLNRVRATLGLRSPGNRGEKSPRRSHYLSQSGMRVREVCYCWRLQPKRASSLSFPRLSLQR
jgi:putative transposase